MEMSREARFTLTPSYDVSLKRKQGYSRVKSSDIKNAEKRGYLDACCDFAICLACLNVFSSLRR